MQGHEISPYKAGIGGVIAIFWTINDPPGLHGLVSHDLMTHTCAALIKLQPIEGTSGPMSKLFT